MWGHPSIGWISPLRPTHEDNIVPLLAGCPDWDHQGRLTGSRERSRGTGTRQGRGGRHRGGTLAKSAPLYQKADAGKFRGPLKSLSSPEVQMLPEADNLNSPGPGRRYGLWKSNFYLVLRFILVFSMQS